MLTDEQLTAYEVESAESCGLGFDECQDIINDLRRLRAEVERLGRLETRVRELWQNLDPQNPTEFNCLSADDVAAIGRLLGGKETERE